MNERLLQSVGPYEEYCDWYGNPESQATRHVLVPVLAVAQADPQSLSTRRYQSSNTERIMAYDSAEVDNTYIGQINMIVVSSFTREYIAGYHLLRPRQGFVEVPSGPSSIDDQGRSIPLYSAEPILEAGKSLFGTKRHKRFPIAAGSMVNAAAKWIEAEGPTHLYSALGIGIAEIPSLGAANLLMEDVGIVPETIDNEADYAKFIADIFAHIGERIRDIQYNQGVVYKEILVASRHGIIYERNMGCALVAAPYVTLAKRAVLRQDGSIRPLTDMTREAWEEELIDEGY